LLSRYRTNVSAQATRPETFTVNAAVLIGTPLTIASATDEWLAIGATAVGILVIWYCVLPLKPTLMSTEAATQTRLGTLVRERWRTYLRAALAGVLLGFATAVPGDLGGAAAIFALGVGATYISFRAGLSLPPEGKGGNSKQRGVENAEGGQPDAQPKGKAEEVRGVA
jgi:hypothetical protein